MALFVSDSVRLDVVTHMSRDDFSAYEWLGVKLDARVSKRT